MGLQMLRLGGHSGRGIVFQESSRDASRWYHLRGRPEPLLGRHFLSRTGSSGSDVPESQGKIMEKQGKCPESH